MYPALMNTVHVGLLLCFEFSKELNFKFFYISLLTTFCIDLLTYSLCSFVTKEKCKSRDLAELNSAWLG